MKNDTRSSLVDVAVERLNPRVLELEVRIETRTADGAVVQVSMTAQYFVLAYSGCDASRGLDDHRQFIASLVAETVRLLVPNVLLADLFERKDEIAANMRDELDVAMERFGYGILKLRVTDIDHGALPWTSEPGSPLRRDPLSEDLQLTNSAWESEGGRVGCDASSVT